MIILKVSTRFLRLFNIQNVQPIARTLFTAETLDLTGYQTNRQDAINNVKGANNFKWELKTYIANETEFDSLHLKNAIEILAHLIDCNDNDDVNLIRKSLYTYNEIKSVTPKAKRSLGNLIMKALHSANNSNGVIKLYHDPKLRECFAGFKSTLICLDSLYKNGEYDEIIEIDSKNRQLFWSQRTNFTKFIDVLIFGACYKLNTVESLDYAHKLWLDVDESTQFRRSAIFVATLALNQRKPSISTQILQASDTNFILQQIKLMVAAELGYANEITETIAFWTSHEQISKHKISKDVMERIKKSLKQNSTINSQIEFQAVYDKLIENNFVTDKTFNELLDRPLSPRIGIRGKRFNVNEILFDFKKND